MRGRLLILIGLIILVAVIAAVLLGSGILNQPPPATTTDNGGAVVQQPPPGATALPTPTPIPLVRIVQAVQNLPRGYRFPTTIEELSNIVGFANWPEEAVPFNAIREDQGGLELVLGKIARTEIFREQPILTTLLVDDLLALAAVGSDAAAILPSDRVMVSMPVDRLTVGAYGIQDGDRVDVIISMLFVDVDEVSQSISPNNIYLIREGEDGLSFIGPIQGRIDQTSLGPAIISPVEEQRPRLVTQRTIQDALVVHVGDFPIDGRFIGVLPTPTPVPQQAAEDAGGGAEGTPPPPPTEIPRPDIISVGVTPQEAVAIVWALDSRMPMTLALRSVNDRSTQLTTPVTLDYMMQQYRIDVPARREYAVQPAITSIRQLVIGDIISLSNQTNTPAPATGQ